MLERNTIERGSSYTRAHGSTYDLAPHHAVPRGFGAWRFGGVGIACPAVMLWLPVATLLVCLAALIVLLYLAWQTRAQFRTRFNRAKREHEQAIARVKGKLSYDLKKTAGEMRSRHKELLKAFRAQEKLIRENTKLLKRQRDALAVMGEAERELSLLHSMLSTLPLEYPVFFGGWSIDAFVGRELLEALERTRPRVVLEIGSGSSTVLIAAVLAKLGLKSTRHIAVDHQEEFLDVTIRHLELQGFGGRTELWYCPLVEAAPGGPPWYQGLPERLSGTSLDFVFVDGPPGTLHPHARRPALDLLRPLLSERAVLILDDALRDEEQATVQAWQEGHPDLGCTLVKRGKGCAIFSLAPQKSSS